MIEIDEMQLLAGDNIVVDGITFRQPTLREIKEIKMNTYYSYISLFLVSSETYLRSIKREDLIPHFQKYNLTMFDIYTDKANVQEMSWFIQALSFFIDGEVKYDEHKHGFWINGNYIITKFNYPQIVDILGKVNGFATEDREEVYANEKAKSIADRIRQAKEKRAKNTNKKDEVCLSTIISAVSAKSHSYNLFNIWDLTVFQLINQYKRLYLIDNFQLHAMNIAFNGGELDADWSKPFN